MIVDFLETSQDSRKMGNARAINYLKSIGDLMGFRKVSGVNDVSLHSFSITEVYLCHRKQCLRKPQKADCSRKFYLETLILKNSWAAVDEIEGLYTWDRMDILFRHLSRG